jgi:hypothetical protein
MDRWRGHLPIASAALLSILERAAKGGSQFSPAERALFTACEFWAAAEGRTLVRYLGASAADPLRFVSIVFAAIGASNVARTLFAAVGELRDAPTPLAQLKCLTGLQERLLKTRDPVDKLIAGFANNLRMSSDTRPEWVRASEENSPSLRRIQS